MGSTATPTAGKNMKRFHKDSSSFHSGAIKHCLLRAEGIYRIGKITNSFSGAVIDVERVRHETLPVPGQRDVAATARPSIWSKLQAFS